MERFFRKIRRNVWKRCGSIASGNFQTQSGGSLALFRNKSNPEYVKAVFDSAYIPAVFAKIQETIQEEGNYEKEDAGTTMIMNCSLQDFPYSESLM
jgi:hypothetical protein